MDPKSAKDESPSVGFTPQDWEPTFEAIAREYRYAHEDIERRPASAAACARRAIEHISLYLYAREIGPQSPSMLDERLKRIDAKKILPQAIAIHFGTVQIHTNFLIHAQVQAREPTARDLGPCFASLEIVVDWFFHDCLKRAAPALPAQAQASSESPAARTPTPPDATPMNTTSTALGGTRFGTGIGEFTPVWRTQRTASTLRLDAPERMAPEQRLLKIEDPKREYTVGRGAKRKDGSANDFALPDAWKTVSQDQAVVSTVEGDVVIRATSGKKNVHVRGEPVETSRTLRHGDVVQLGGSVGVFLDGRYYAAAPATMIDARTGLLSRGGLVVEMAGAMAMGKGGKVLFVIRCASGQSGDLEAVAAEVARALHQRDPSVPIARIGSDVALLLAAEASGASHLDVARAIAPGCVAGFLTLSGEASQAIPKLEASLGALSRIAIAGRETKEPEDLARYALLQTPIEEFPARAKALFDVGGGAILFALGEIGRLEQLAPQALPILELELLEALGARMAPRDVVSFAGRGLLAFGTPGDVERLAHEVDVEWHARGPVTIGSLEMDRSLSAHLLAPGDLVDLPRQASKLVAGGISALGLGGFPSPIALEGRFLDDANEPVERARRVVRVAEHAWQFLAFVLLAAARAARTGPAPAPSGGAGWPPPWRALARDAAKQLPTTAGRISELGAAALAADDDATVRGAMEALASATGDASAVPRLERAVRELFGSLGALRGWTLVGVESSEIVDLDGTTQRIEYVDYTGPSARGSRQRVAAVGFRGLGRFVYLVRWGEGLAIALEPFVRRARNESTGETELFLATAPIASPGTHRFRSISSACELDLVVTPKQLGT